MVELVLVSVGIVAVVLFLINVRSIKTGGGEPRALDGRPRWVPGVVKSVERTGSYLGFTTAKLVLEVGPRTEQASGPLPVRYDNRIVPGLEVEGHIDYDLLDTLRTALWDTTPSAVLAVCAAKLGVDATPTGDDPLELAFERDGRAVSVMLAEDGWVTIVVATEAGADVYVDLRADFDEAERGHMLTERLGTTRDHADAAQEFLAGLGPESLARLEAFAVGVEGWICVDEGAEFECALPFPEGELIATLVDEAVEVVALLETDAAPEQQQSDGAW